MAVFGLGFNKVWNSLKSKMFVVNNMDVDVFCDIFINNLYDRIIKTLYDRTIFPSDFETHTMFDCPITDRQNHGFMTLLRHALVHNDKIALRYDPVSKTITTLVENYTGETYTCCFDFKYLTNLNIALMYYAKSLFLLSKSFNVKVLNSSSLMIYLNGLTNSVAKNQVDGINIQIDSLVDNINRGGTGVLDSDSRIESGIVDVSGINEGNNFIMQQISLLLKYSVNFLTGKSTTGLGSSGEQDQEKDFKSLSISFNEFWKPIIEKLYNTEIELKIDKWQLSDTHRSYMDWIETNSLLPKEIKQELIATILESNGLIDSKQANIIKKYKAQEITYS